MQNENSKHCHLRIKTSIIESMLFFYRLIDWTRVFLLKNIIKIHI